MKSVAQKMGIKDGERSLFVNAPEDAIRAIELPEIEISESASGEFDYIHLFIIDSAELEKEFPKLKKHLKTEGKLWVSWPKAKQLGSDLTVHKVIEICYNFGLVESTNLSVNSVWTALKFTHPKKNKEYNNSYGKLKQRTTSR